jgi:hypothetical protein
MGRTLGWERSPKPVTGTGPPRCARREPLPAWVLTLLGPTTRGVVVGHGLVSAHLIGRAHGDPWTMGG